MRWLRAWFSRLGSFTRRARRERELRQELESHLQLHVEENLRAGMTSEQARRAALMKLGGVEQTKESYRERRSLPLLETLFQDFRYGLRMLRKSPGFAAVAVLTLALGIGANTAMFSAVYSVMLKPLPFRDAGRLLFLRKKNPPRGWTGNTISDAEIVGWRNRTQAFEALAAFQGSSCVLTGMGDPEEDPCDKVESNLFSVLGITPIRGRTFNTEEDQPGSGSVILSYAMWQRRFGGADNAVGTQITINGASYTVVGVMPASLGHLYATPYADPAELWISGMRVSPTSTWNDSWAVGRLKAGATRTEAENEMNVVSANLEKSLPDLKGWRVQPSTLRELTSGDVRPALLLLLGAVTFVLLIACVNVANLMLARSAGRTAEFAVRKALGAKRQRLIQQLLTESLLIASCGAVLGIFVAVWLRKGLVALAPQSLLNSSMDLAKSGVDLVMLVFTLLIAVAACVAFGLGPALRSAEGSANEVLKAAGKGSLEGAGSRSFRSGLVVTEIALSVVLLVGAGLMIRTLVELSAVPMGLNPEHVLTLRVPLAGKGYEKPTAVAEFWKNVVAGVEALPDVESASVARGLPIADWAGQDFTTAEDPNPPAGSVPDANYVVVGPQYFRALQIRLIEGRSFTEDDGLGHERVAIVSQELVRRNWRNGNALGRRIRMGYGQTDAPWLTVVGVVGEVLSQGPTNGRNPQIYVPYEQYPWVLSPKNLVVRVRGTRVAAGLVPAIAHEIHRVDPNQPVVDIKMLSDVVAEQIAEEHMVMVLLVAFGVLALLLAAVGTYSVLAYSVAQRTREIGLRMAMGAEPRNVLRMVLGNGGRLAIAGVGVGTLVALALTQLMTDLLFGVRPMDPLTFALVAVFLAGITLAACYIPARRAANVDPMAALRYE